MTAPQLAPGTVVAQKYRLAALIGYSGSAATYQATGSDGRDVVLKLFDPAMRQRADIMSAIEQTYAATNALPQDVAAPLLDAGYDAATGAPFSVGERIAFPSLTQLVAQRPMPADDVARVIGALATLLDQAHARGLFHHALKPANVFVGFAQGQGIRVTDFGAGLPRAAVPSQEGYVAAAPWLAPEQVLASAPPAGAADVFSVGLIAFFALTGRSYWRSCQGAVDLNGWQQELGAPRTPPSARARELGAVLNSAFDGVLGCALSVDPGQRYRSVRELAQALEGLVAARAPESQATQAFNPASLGLGPGGYPPPPQPPGGGYPPQPAGYAAAPGAPGGPVLPAQAYPTLQNGYGAPQPAPSAPGPWGGGQVAQQAPAGNNANGQQAYVATQTPPVNTQNPQLEETAAGRVLMAQAAAPRPATNRFAPILVGVVALLLLAGGAGAWVVMGKRAHADATTDATSATPTATASPSASAPAEAPTTSAPADTASAAPRDSASALPADTTPPAASGQAAAGSAPVDSTLACDPDCDEIRVDDKPIELGKPVDLPAGKHVIVATKSGFLSARETIVVTAGEKVERTFKLKPLPTGPAPTPAISAPTKPCGKFLKRAGCK